LQFVGYIYIIIADYFEMVFAIHTWKGFEYLVVNRNYEMGWNIHPSAGRGRFL